MLLDDIKARVTKSLKKGDHLVVETLRLLISAVQNEAIRKYGAQAHEKVTEEDVTIVIKKQIKTHKESIEMFEKAGRKELVDKEKAELEVLKEYVPSQLPEEELQKLLMPIALEGGDFGPLMGKAMAVVKGQADGDRVSKALRSLVAAQGKKE